MKKIALAVLFILTLTADGQNIIYKPGDFGSLSYLTAVDGTIYADDVLLSGSRLVGTLKISALGPIVGSSVTSDVTAYLYAGDNFGGFPGTLLWSSTRLDRAFFNATTVVFTNVNTLVPPLFYWGVRFTNSHPVTNIFGPLFAVSTNAVPTNSTGKRFVYTGTGSPSNPISFAMVDATLAVTIEEGIIPVNPTLDISRAVALGFVGGLGTNYVAQYTTNLLQGFWFDLGPVLTADGTTQYFHDNTPDVPNRSYRLLVPP